MNFSHYQSSQVYAYNFSFYTLPKVIAKTLWCLMLEGAYLCILFFFVYLITMLPVLLNIKTTKKALLDCADPLSYGDQPTYNFKTCLVFCLKLLFTRLLPSFTTIAKKVPWFYNLSATSWILCLGVANLLYFPYIPYGNHYSFMFLCILCVRRLFAAYFNIKHLLSLDLEIYVWVQLLLHFKWKTKEEESFVLDRLPLKFKLSLLLSYCCLHTSLLYLCFDRLITQACNL